MWNFGIVGGSTVTFDTAGERDSFQ